MLLEYPSLPANAVAIGSSRAPHNVVSASETSQHELTSPSNSQGTLSSSIDSSTHPLASTIIDHVSPPAPAYSLPPIPPYSPPSASYLSIPPYVPQPNHPLASSTSSNQSPQVVESSHATQDVNFIHYARMYDHRGASEWTGVRRFPETLQADSMSLRSSQPPESLPPYGSNDPPPYRRPLDNSEAEPQTLAMFFFKSGFFFPAFWIFGALILVTPLRSPNPFLHSSWPPNGEFAAWCNEHIRTEEDKAEFLAKMHAVEIKWAKRCLLALVIMICFSVAIGATIFAVLKVGI